MSEVIYHLAHEHIGNIKYEFNFYEDMINIKKIETFKHGCGYSTLSTFLKIINNKIIYDESAFEQFKLSPKTIYYINKLVKLKIFK